MVRVRLDNVEGCEDSLVFVLARDEKTQKYFVSSCMPRVWMSSE